MYVGYLLDKDTNMYPSPVRHPGLNLNPQNYVPGPPQYSDFASYHHVPGINNDLHHGQPAAAWGSPYTPAKEDWHSYGTPATPSTASPGQFGFSPPDFNPIQPPGSGLLPPPISSSVPQLSPNAQRRTPYEWMRRSIPSTSSSGKENPSALLPCVILGIEALWGRILLYGFPSPGHAPAFTMAPDLKLQGDPTTMVAGAEDGQGAHCPSVLLTDGVLWLESPFPSQSLLLHPCPCLVG